VKEKYITAFVDSIELVHEDGRRVIAEMNSTGADFSVQRFVIKEKIALGNHYHDKKEEVFVILKGSGEITLMDDAAQKTFAVKEGDVIFVPRGTGHTFVLEPGSEMICFSTSAFDKDDFHPWMPSK